jgi:hypothetical protein
MIYDETRRVAHSYADADRSGALIIPSMTVEHPNVIHSQHRLIQ